MEVCADDDTGVNEKEMGIKLNMQGAEVDEFKHLRPPSKAQER